MTALKSYDLSAKTVGRLPHTITYFFAEGGVIPFNRRYIAASA
jgi:hypothetical protein